MPTTTEAEQQRADELAELAIDCYAAAGLRPADESQTRWVAERYAAFSTLADGYLVAWERDERLRLQVLTPSGVIRSEAEFDLTDFGAAMFVAAATAARTVKS